MQPLLADLAEQFYAFMEGRNAPGTIAYYRTNIRRFVQAVGNLPVGELRKHHLLTWGKTWHEMQSVQRLFQWAHAQMELIDRNPFKDVKRPRAGMRKRIISPRDFARILRATDPWFRALLIAMRETIARPQEMRGVTWECIRCDEANHYMAEALLSGSAYFELWEYKSRTQRTDKDAPRNIPISPRLARLLARLLERAKSNVGPIFLNARGKPWTNNAVRLRMRRLRDRLHLGADHRGENLVAYSIRHTQATNASANGVPDKILAEVMGHTTTRTTARYQHLSTKHLLSAMRAAWQKKLR